MGSEGFRMELFTIPSEYEEEPLRDRKSKLYNLRDDREKAEFLRDVIALANAARAWGKPAYLIFGLDNEGNLVSIHESLQPYSTRSLPTDEKGLMEVIESIRQQMAQIIGWYISPPLYLWELKWYWDESRNLLVAYLVIEPDCPEMAFHVARDLTSGNTTLLFPGDCWIRSGESRRRIGLRALSQSDRGYRRTPFIPPSKWLKYFEALLSKEEIQQALRITHYVDLHDSEGTPLQKIVQQFLEDRRGRAILVIEGPPGSGKTTFLHRLVGEWAEMGMEDMKKTRQRKEFKQPSGWIPVYFQLRDANFSEGLAKEILRQANSNSQPFWEEEPSEPERLLENPDLHWLICFDGLDELWEQREIKRFLQNVQVFHRRYPRVKILLTSRPVVTIPEDFQVVRIAPLSEKDMLTYLRAFLTEEDEAQYGDLIEQLLNPGSELYPLREICAFPLYLESLVSLLVPASPTTLEGEAPQEHREYFGPPLTIGWALDRIVQKVWDREAQRRSIRQDQLFRWWRATGRLSLKMNGHREFENHEEVEDCYSSPEGLQWVLNLGILQASRKGIRFSHKSLQHYFGATYLKSEAEASREEWKSRCAPDFWHAVIILLNQIQYEEVPYGAAE